MYLIAGEQPDELMQNESEYHLRQMIKRDFNHPSIFSWIVFNETWGLTTKVMHDGKEQNQIPARNPGLGGLDVLSRQSP